MPKDFLNRLRQGPVLGDGGYFLELERRCLGSYKHGVPLAVLDHPDGVLELHREFARAGAEVLQAVTWGVGRIDREEELHRTAVALAREAAGPDRYVAGTLSPYFGKRRPQLSAADRQEVAAFFDRRVGQQVAAGVDLFIVETFHTVAEASIAIPFVEQAGIPAVVTLTYQENDFTRDGLSPTDGAQQLVDNGADVVGINCHRPPQTLLPLARAVRKAVDVPVCVQPTAYELEPGAVYNREIVVPGLWTTVEPRVLSRFAVAEYAKEAESIGIEFIGACCGMLPYHIRAMADALGKPSTLPDRARAYSVGNE